ncbi:MAG: glycosyltransferase family 4 protein [Dissulfurispiraceae bacterium]
MDDRIKLVSYLPHGLIPDIRGFAPAIVAYNLTKYLNSVSVFTICNRESCVENYEINGEIGPITRIGEGRIYRRLFRKISRLDPYPLHRRAAAIVNRISPDIFHAHQLEFPINDFLKRLKKKIPIVVHAHVTNRKFSPERGCADLYVAVSSYVRGRLIEQGYPEERIEVVYNGVDTGLFQPVSVDKKTAIRKGWNIPEDACVVSFVGRMQEVKGFHIFLQTVEILLNKYHNLYVIVVGSKQHDEKREKSYDLRTRVRKRLLSGYEKRYIEFPPMPHSDLSNVFKAADISFQPSQIETQGMAVIEAMASGCISISTNVGGIKESISHGETGFLLDNPDDIDGATQLIGDIIEYASKYDYIRDNARRFILQNFDWKISATKTEDLYFKLYGKAISGS